MAYQLLPNIILLLSILGIVVLVLRRLPEAANSHQEEAAEHALPQQRMLAKGLPARAASQARTAIMVFVKRIWHFMLEAKGLRQAPSINYKINKLFRRRPVNVSPVVDDQPAHNEQHFLDQIKKFPKALENYDHLGKYYLDAKNYGEVRNVYDYLTKHDAASADYWARLAFAQLHLHQYLGAINSYNKSLALDSSHPNRYYNLALAHNALKQNARAVEALDKALSLEPKNVKYLQILAETHHLMGRADKAREVSRRISQSTPL